MGDGFARRVSFGLSDRGLARRSNAPNEDIVNLSDFLASAEEARSVPYEGFAPVGDDVGRFREAGGFLNRADWVADEVAKGSYGLAPRFGLSTQLCVRREVVDDERNIALR